MPVTQHDHGPVFYHCGKSLETRRRQQVGWNDGNPSTPQVLDDGVQDQAAIEAPDLLAPRKSIGRGAPRCRHWLLQVAHHGAGDPNRSVDCWSQTVAPEVTDAPKLGPRIPRGLQR